MVTKYTPIYAPAKEGETPKRIGRQYAGPRGHKLSGLDKNLAKYAFENPGTQIPASRRPFRDATPKRLRPKAAAPVPTT